MDRLCTECGCDIDDGLNSPNTSIRFVKADQSGDLCKKCWDIEWKKCISRAEYMSKKEYKKGVTLKVHKAHIDNMKISANTQKIQERVVVEQEKLDYKIATVSDKIKGNKVRLQEIRENRLSWKDIRTVVELMIIIAEELMKLNEKCE